MSGVSLWVISIVGVIIACVLVDIVLPSSDISKYIKSVLGLIVAVIIIAPIPNFIKGDFSFSSNSIISEISLDDDFLDYIDGKKEDSMRKTVKDILKKNGYEEVSVFVVTSAYGEIEKISCDLKNLVIKKDKSNINIIEDIENILTESFGISKESVVIYGT